MATREQLKGHIIVCGYGIVGERIVESLQGKNKILVIDMNRDKVDLLRERGYDAAILGDATSSKILKEAGVQNAKAIAIVMDDDAKNLFTVITAKSLNKKIIIATRANSDFMREKLADAGANFIVTPNLSASEELFNEIKKQF